MENKTGASSLSEESKPKFYYGYVIVACSFVVLMLVFGAQYSFSVFFKPMLKEFGLSRAVLSGAYSLYLAMQAAAGIFAGKLTDKYGPRLVVTCCGLCLGVSYLLMSRVQHTWEIYIFFGVFASLGSACAWVPLLTTIARWFVSTRGLMSGIAVAGVGVGTLLVPPLCGYLISNLGWRTSYIVIGAGVLVLIVISAQLLKPDPSCVRQSPGGVSVPAADNLTGYNFRETLRTRQFWLLCGAYLLLAACCQSIFVHIVPYATDVGISEVTAATIISVIGGVSIISKVSVGMAVDRLGNKPVALIISSLMLISLIIVQFTHTIWMLYLFAVIFAFGYGGFIAIQSPYMAELFGLKSFGVIFGFCLFIFLGVASLGPLVTGRMFDAASSYSPAFVMLAVLNLMAILLILGIKKPSGR